MVAILEDHGEELSKFSDLEDYTIFAVQYRYEAYDTSEELLDRRKVIDTTNALLVHVEAELAAMP